MCRIAAFALVGAVALATAHAEDAAGIDRKIGDTAKYLSSDELEGRGIGTAGLETAAQFIAKEFEKIGLNTALFEESPFQRFEANTSARLGEHNTLALVQAGNEPQKRARVELEQGKDFTTLAAGNSGKFDLPLAFAGYGITAKAQGYDDYSGLDAKGKMLIILRHLPQQSNSHNALKADKAAQHDAFSRKLANAYEHGAAGVIFTTSAEGVEQEAEQYRRRWRIGLEELLTAAAEAKTNGQNGKPNWNDDRKRIDEFAEQLLKYGRQADEALDPLIGFNAVRPDSGGRDFPVLYCRRAAIDKLLESSVGSSLTEIERKIDADLTPQTRDLANWRAVGQTSVERQKVEVKNVVGVLEGEGPLAAETIVIGAHYDHLGYGDGSSLAPGIHEVHNGADDNASGVAALLDVARRLASRPKKLPRRIVLVAFTGEERGLLGSARYVKQPAFPLDQTIAMLNMDMVGRLRDNKLIVHGTGTADAFNELVDRLGKQFGFQISKNAGGFGPSDHASFYAKKIPVLFFFTGSHEDYHRPSDDYEKLNLDGVRRVSELVARAAVELAESKDRPKYQETAAPPALARTGSRPYFGSIPDFSEEQVGYALSGVTKGGPAARAGLRGGDVIVRFGDSKVGNLEDFDSALRKFKAGDRVPVVVKRGADEMKFEVVLDPARE